VFLSIQVLAMVFIRKGLDYVFTQAELKCLDDIMPETSKREKDDEEIKKHETDVRLAYCILTLLLYFGLVLNYSFFYKQIYV